MTRLRRALLAAFLLASASLPRAVDAQAPDALERGWLDLGAGGGRVQLEDTGANRGAFALDFAGGFWLRSRVGLGVRLGGWTLEGFDVWNPEEGESLSEAFAVVRLRPLGARPLVTSLEGGWVRYTVNDPAEVLREGGGLGARVALAWEARLWSRWAVSPALVASWGRIDPDWGPERTFGYWGVGALLGVGWRW